MGRNYITSQGPSFIEGIYTPPWELINSALESNQRGYDTALASTSLFDNLNIQHINDPIIKEKVGKIQQEYNQKVQEIVNTLQKDPTSWRKANMSIQNLSKDLQKNIMSGDIARYQKQYSDLSNFMKEHEEYRKKYPEYFNQALNYYMKKFQEDPERQSDFTYNSLVTPFDQKEFLDEVQKLKASATVTKDGLYLIENKEVPYEQIDATARGIVYGRYSGFLNQQKEFGNTDFYNAEYEKMHPETGGIYENLYYDSNGRLLGGDNDKAVIDRKVQYTKDVAAYNKLTPKEKEKAVVPTLDLNLKSGAIGRTMNLARAAGHYQEISIKEDPVALALYEEQRQQARHDAEMALQREKFNADQAQRVFENNLDFLTTISKQKQALIDDEGKITDPVLYKDLSDDERTATRNFTSLVVKNSGGTKTGGVTGGSEDAAKNTTLYSLNYNLYKPGSKDALVSTIGNGLRQESGTPHNNLAKDYINKLSTSISKVENKNQREYLQRFMNFYKQEVKNNPNTTLDALATKFAAKDEYKGKEGKRMTSKEYVPDNQFYGPAMSSFSSSPASERANIKRVNTQVGSDFIIRSMKNFGYNNYVEAVKKIEQTKEVVVEPVTKDFDISFKNLMFAPGNQSAFTIYPLDNNGVFGEPLEQNSKVYDALKTGKATIESATNRPIRNGSIDNVIVKYEGKTYVIEPPQITTSGIATTIHNILKQPWATVGGESSITYEQRNQPEAYNLTNQLDNLISEGKNIASISKKIGGQDVEFTQVYSNGKNLGYIAKVNGTPLYDVPMPSLIKTDGDLGLYKHVENYIANNYGR